MQALPFIESGEEFRTHNLKTDADIFGLMIDVRPCVAVFSIPGPEHTRKVCQLLESFRLYRTALGYPSRDPTLRIVLVAEERAVAIERWHELGVHEFVIAPILPRALAYKTQRHHNRAVVSRIPEPVIESHEEEVVVIPAGKKGEPVIYHRIGTPLAPVHENESATHFSAPRSEPSKDGGSHFRYSKKEGVQAVQAPPNRFRMTASLPDLSSAEGHWEGTPSPGTDGGDDSAWDWAWHPPKDKEAKHTYKYRGERPVYDAKRGGWQLRGKEPELVMTRKDGTSQKLIAIEEVEGSKQIIVDQAIEIQEITEESYRPMALAAGTESETRRGTGIGAGRTAGEKDPLRSGNRTLISEHPKERRWNAGGSRIEDQQTPDAKNLSSRGTSSESLADKPEKARTDFTQEEPEPKLAHSPHVRSREEAEEISSKNRAAPQEKESSGSSRKKLSSEEENPAASYGKLHGAQDEESEGPSFSLGEEGPAEISTANPSTKEKNSDDLQIHDDPHDDPLIARLEAAILGKAPAPKENLAGRPSSFNEDPGKPRTSMTSTMTEDSSKESAQRSHSHSLSEDAEPTVNYKTLQKRNPFPKAENRIRLDESEKDPERDLQIKVGSGQAKGGEMRLKTSGDAETNTWSMQNLEDGDGLGQVKKPDQAPTPQEETAQRLVESLLQEGLNVSDPAESLKTLPMDPEEKARLLKQIYASLQLKPEAASETPEEDREGFFAALIEAIKSLFSKRG